MVLINPGNTHLTNGSNTLLLISCLTGLDSINSEHTIKTYFHACSNPIQLELDTSHAAMFLPTYGESSQINTANSKIKEAINFCIAYQIALTCK